MKRDNLRKVLISIGILALIVTLAVAARRIYLSSINDNSYEERVREYKKCVNKCELNQPFLYKIDLCLCFHPGFQ